MEFNFFNLIISESDINLTFKLSNHLVYFIMGISEGGVAGIHSTS